MNDTPPPTTRNHDIPRAQPLRSFGQKGLFLPLWVDRPPAGGCKQRRRHSPPLPLAWLLLSLLASPHCARAPLTGSDSSGGEGKTHSSSAGDGVTPQSTQPAEAAAFARTEQAFNQDSPDLLRQMAQFRKTYPHSALLPLVDNLEGLSFYKKKQLANAIRLFQRSLTGLPATARLRAYILYNLASAQVEHKQLPAADHQLKQIHWNDLDLGNRFKTLCLWSRLHLASGKPLAGLKNLLSIGPLLADPTNGGQSFERQARELLREALKHFTQPGPLLPLLSSTASLTSPPPAAVSSAFSTPPVEGSSSSSPNPPPAVNPEQEPPPFEHSPLLDEVYLRVAQLALGESSNVPLGEQVLATLGAQYPQSPLLPEAERLIGELRQGHLTDHPAVGVLLPLKGKLGRFGLRSLQAIQLAFAAHHSAHATATPSFEVVAEDSGEEIEESLAALNKLAAHPNVVAVIGPMASRGLEALAQRAQSLGLPLLSLARKSLALSGMEPTSLNYTFQMGLTPEIQTYALAKHTIEDLGIKRFGVIYPESKEGLALANYFWDALEQLGGKITAIEGYPPGETDFRETIDKLSSVYYPGARQRELEAMAHDRANHQIARRTKKNDAFFQLPPIVDFEAIFFAGDAKEAGQMIPTCAYRDIDHIRFLGPATWNSPDFLTRIQNYGEGATFVDALFHDSQQTKTQDFISQYQDSFHQEPGSLEAIAFDAAQILKSLLLKRTHAISRATLRDTLRLLHDFPGLTGSYFIKDGKLFRKLSIIEVKSGKLVEFQATG